MSPAREYPCPCCGYLMLHEPPGSYDICPICFWEDDLSQLRFPRSAEGANRVSLLEAQRNFASFGATEEGGLPHVRKVGPEDRRDQGWRPIDPRTDNIEDPLPGVDYGTTYPRDSTVLYYWRPAYWRKPVV